MTHSSINVSLSGELCVALAPWEPEHEMTHRILVPPDGVLGRIQMDEGIEPLVHRWVMEALGPIALT